MVEVIETRDGPAKTVELGNAIAVASGKGGVGKTWLSITLCHALARAGRKVLLFDGDLGLANVDIQLGLAPDREIKGAVFDTQEPLLGAHLPPLADLVQDSLRATLHVRMLRDETLHEIV